MSESLKKIDSFVLFGVLGDLSIRKLIPAWYYLERDNMLSDSLQILGVGRKDVSDQDLKERIKESLNEFVSGIKVQVFIQVFIHFCWQLAFNF